MAQTSFLKALIDLCRVSNLPTVWTNVLAALVLSGAPFTLREFLILCLSLSLFYSGGMCLNDICDYAEDRKTKPFRPIPSGRTPLKTAYAVTTALFVIAVLLLLLFPHRHALITGFALLVTIIAYDALHKAHPLTVLLMAACRLQVFVVSATALTGHVATYVALAGGLQFLYVLVISLVARHEKSRTEYTFPVIPWMIAGISVLDGVVMAVLASFPWLGAGITGAALTRIGQRYVRGD